ncbi:hypothetical protein CRUP_003608 [Coryphaenoides rupestris]|nr:hypothetical protein CRUP_003608 [Coryphaenoides rupestris]
MSLPRSSLALLVALCVSAVAGEEEETTATAVPLRIRPEGRAHPWRTLSAEERQKESEMRLYRLEAFGAEFLLRLEPDQTFLAPGFVFHVVGTGPESAGPPPVTGAEPRCFYSGTVNGEEHSVAAFNLCTGGLTGGFYLQGQEYFVQPLNATDAGESEGEEEEVLVLHTIRRRGRSSLAEEGSAKCGVNEDEAKVPENLESPKVSGGAQSSDQKGKHVESVMQVI